MKSYRHPQSHRPSQRKLRRRARFDEFLATLDEMARAADQADAVADFMLQEANRWSLQARDYNLKLAQRQPGG